MSAQPPHSPSDPHPPRPKQPRPPPSKNPSPRPPLASTLTFPGSTTSLIDTTATPSPSPRPTLTHARPPTLPIAAIPPSPSSYLGTKMWPVLGSPMPKWQPLLPARRRVKARPPPRPSPPCTHLFSPPEGGIQNSDAVGGCQKVLRPKAVSQPSP